MNNYAIFNFETTKIEVISCVLDKNFSNYRLLSQLGGEIKLGGCNHIIEKWDNRKEEYIVIRICLVLWMFYLRFYYEGITPGHNIKHLSYCISWSKMGESHW